MQGFTEADGRQLAADMLLELRDAGADATCLDAGIRIAVGLSGPQNNVVARYLRELRKRDSAELDAGFAGVVSEFIGSALDGSVIDPEEYFDD